LSHADPGKEFTLLGLYEGVPLTQRNTYYGNVIPDKITIFQKALEEKCGTDEIKLRREIEKVVRHEIAHHFGIDDDRLREINRY
jgi:predicted Zn-dependent protease with MMP-like domain